jgi:hypothetical protein
LERPIPASSRGVKKASPEMRRNGRRLSTFLYQKGQYLYKNVIPHDKHGQKNVNGNHLSFRRFKGENPGALLEACVANGKRA